jgi:hypothetical protein
MTEVFIVTGAVGAAFFAIVFLRVSIDFFTRGASDIARMRGIGFGWTAWRKGELPPADRASDWNTMRGLHVHVTDEGIAYSPKATVSSDVV